MSWAYFMDNTVPMKTPLRYCPAPSKYIWRPVRYHLHADTRANFIKAKTLHTYISTYNEMYCSTSFFLSSKIKLQWPKFSYMALMTAICQFGVRYAKSFINWHYVNRLLITAASSKIKSLLIDRQFGCIEGNVKYRFSIQNLDYTSKIQISLVISRLSKFWTDSLS